MGTGIQWCQLGSGTRLEQDSGLGAAGLAVGPGDLHTPWGDRGTALAGQGPPQAAPHLPLVGGEGAVRASNAPPPQPQDLRRKGKEGFKASHPYTFHAARML